MPRRGGKHFTLLAGAEGAMQAFRMEIAEELGFADKVRQQGWQSLSSQEVGSVGGEMVKRIVIAGEIEVLRRHQAGERLCPEIPENIRLNEEAARRRREQKER